LVAPAPWPASIDVCVWFLVKQIAALRPDFRVPVVEEDCSTEIFLPSAVALVGLMMVSGCWSRAKTPAGWRYGRRPAGGWRRAGRAAAQALEKSAGDFRETSVLHA
jgi:hypothetical protein